MIQKNDKREKMMHNRLLCGFADGENLRRRPQRNRRGRLCLMAPSENIFQLTRPPTNRVI